ncbi:MAG: TIGR02391 family protein [Acidobacteriota bacterium]|nr:TIGR02391 family protein [Acidobacteriota bacterium]
MPRTTKPPQRREANLSFAQMQEALPKLDRRIKDLDEFDVNTVNERSDPQIEALETKLDTLLTSIFGADTVEYQRYCSSVTRLDTAPVNYAFPTAIGEVREGLRQGVATSKAQLEAIKTGFLEDLEDAGQTLAGKTLKAYEGLELHPAIERAAGKLFRDGHYANAIEDAVKALNALVKLNSGVDDKDGTQLMEFVFSPKNPILKFNSLADQSDLDEQKGFMMMFSGAVAGLRNPRAHKIIKDESEKALVFVAFISLLAKLADSAKK